MDTQVDLRAHHRENMRRLARVAALVVTNDGRCSQNARIVNRSPSGALVELDGIGVFPDTFLLRVDGRKLEATRVWSRGLKAGVIFKN